MQSKITFAILRAVTAKGCWFTDILLSVGSVVEDLERVIPRTSSALHTSRPWGGLEDAPPIRHLGETRTNYILFDLWQTKAPNQFRRNLAQPGSASALGAEGREFESLSSDQSQSRGGATAAYKAHNLVTEVQLLPAQPFGEVAESANASVLKTEVLTDTGDRNPPSPPILDGQVSHRHRPWQEKQTDILSS